MITAHILTKNNEKTIKNTLESIYVLKPKILIGDFGSTDSTLQIAKKFNATIVPVKGMIRNEARERLANMSMDDWNLWIEPWEIIFQNPKSYESLKSDSGYVRVVSNQNLNWEIRLWKNKCKFVNPVFETIDANKAEPCSMVISSRGGPDIKESLNILEDWKKQNPLKSEPYYYQACLLLAEEKYDEFLKIANHYMFLEKNPSVPVVMTRYYYAVVQMTQKKLVKPTLQNLNLCLSVNPLMAEFWCLMGDVYYHLLNNFLIAKEFYENAIILGSHRKHFDKWPMDISKYNKYPNKMIKSCDEILKTRSDYIPV